MAPIAKTFKANCAFTVNLRLVGILTPITRGMVNSGAVKLLIRLPKGMAQGRSPASPSLQAPDVGSGSRTFALYSNPIHIRIVNR